MRTQPAKWATVVYQIAHHALSHVSRARFLSCMAPAVTLRFAPPQALCFHSLPELEI